jgi:hypothetical protein
VFEHTAQPHVVDRSSGAFDQLGVDAAFSIGRMRLEEARFPLRESYRMDIVGPGDLDVRAVGPEYLNDESKLELAGAGRLDATEAVYLNDESKLEFKCVVFAAFGHDISSGLGEKISLLDNSLS